MGLKAAMVLAVALLAPAPDEKSKLKLFTSAAGKYKVLLFPDPRKREQAAAGVTMYVAINDMGSRAILVAYADIPIPAGETAEQTQTRLDGAKNGAIKNINGKLIREAKITLGKHPGRQFSAELPGSKGVMKARVYLVGKRLYQIMAVGPKDFTDSADVKKMFDSFELTK
jgi:hypothetical protein